MAVAQAMEVLPTPPLPVKNRKRGRLFEKVHGGDFAVHQHQRQRLGTRALQKCLHGGILDEVHRLLGQVEALDDDALLLRPVEVGGEADQRLVDVLAAHATAAAQGGIKNLDGIHGSSL
jgi:hypothetical protein